MLIIGLGGGATLSAVPSSVDEIDVIGQTYTDMAVAGACTPEQRALFIDAGRRMIESDKIRGQTAQWRTVGGRRFLNTLATKG